MKRLLIVWATLVATLLPATALAWPIDWSRVAPSAPGASVVARGHVVFGASYVPIPPPGASGTVLTSTGTTTEPAWSTVSVTSLADSVTWGDGTSNATILGSTNTTSTAVVDTIQASAGEAGGHNGSDLSVFSGAGSSGNRPGHLNLDVGGVATDGSSQVNLGASVLAGTTIAIGHNAGGGAYSTTNIFGGVSIQNTNNATALVLNTSGFLTLHSAGSATWDGTAGLYIGSSSNGSMAFGNGNNGSITIQPGGVSTNNVLVAGADGTGSIGGGSGTFRAGNGSGVGTGGAWSGTGGNGSTPSGGAGSAAGTWTGAAGNGGAGDTGGHSGATGGATTLMGGNGGASTGSANNANGGAATFDGGAAGTGGSGTAGVGGALNLGITNAGSVAIGRSAITTTIAGTVKLSALGTGIVQSSSLGVLSSSSLAVSSLTAGSNNQIIDTHSAAAAWVTPGGDVSYTSPSFTVTGLQGNALSAPAGTNSVLQYSGSALQWGGNAASLTLNGGGSGHGVNLQGNGTTLEDVGVTTAGIVTRSGGVAPNLVSKTSSYTLDSGSTPDEVVLASCSSACTITLPTPSAKRRVTIKDSSGLGAHGGNITIARHASESIDGVAAGIVGLPNDGDVTLVSDGTNWWVLSVGMTGDRPAAAFALLLALAALSRRRRANDNDRLEESA